MWDTVRRGGVAKMLHGGGKKRRFGTGGAGCAVVVALLGIGLVVGSAAGYAWREQAGGAAAPTSAVHSIGVAFNYDFTKTPACTTTITKNCVTKFEVFDISVPGMQRLLFTIAVPPNAVGKTNLIKASSPRLPFVIGKHRLGVSAITPENLKSDPLLCATIVTVGA